MVVSTTATTQGVNYFSFDMGFSVHTPRGMEAGGSPALAWVGDSASFAGCLIDRPALQPHPQRQMHSRFPCGSLTIVAAILAVATCTSTTLTSPSSKPSPFGLSQQFQVQLGARYNF